jgi:hypothetical protein
MKMHTVIAWLVAFALAVFAIRSLSIVNGYANLTTNLGNTQPSKIFDSEENIQCVPGPGPDADYYTGEAGGGFCGMQETVHQLGHQYSIQSGIGGSLLAD